LSQSKHNQAILDVIESSAFVVCLDSETPETHVEFSKANWFGGVEGGELGNRWYV
jgi:carnitine O-acetyltransferase